MTELENVLRQIACEVYAELGAVMMRRSTSERWRWIYASGVSSTTANAFWN
jgi:hypothetical protein